MKSIWVLAVVLAFVAGSIVTGTVAYAISSAAQATNKGVAIAIKGCASSTNPIP